VGFRFLERLCGRRCARFRRSAAAVPMGGGCERIRGRDRRVSMGVGPRRSAAWDAPYGANLTSAPEATFNAGTHTLFVEAIDRAGDRTLGRVTVAVVPFRWIGISFSSTTIWARRRRSPILVPSETQDDEFWARICAKAPAFDPSRDVYDWRRERAAPPGVDVLGRYKNVVWNYSVLGQRVGADVVFTPESRVGTTSKHSNQFPLLFLLKGGHFVDAGGSERGRARPRRWRPGAGLSATVECEGDGTKSSCGGTGAARRTWPTADFCVSVLDKVKGAFRTIRDAHQGRAIGSTARRARARCWRVGRPPRDCPGA